ncbi:hypothetical protein SFC08_16805 [Lysinibacillus halotolerans]
MGTTLVQMMVDVVFKGYLLYLAPILFVLMVILFADRLIDLIVNAISLKSNGRRNSY